MAPLAKVLRMSEEEIFCSPVAKKSLISKGISRRAQAVCNHPAVNTIQANIPLVEVNLFDFNEDIYGEQLTVDFYAKLRDEVKFNGLPALVAQLTADREQAKKILQGAF